MSNIGGKKKEQQQFDAPVRKVGLFEANVVAINPNAEECKDILGFWGFESHSFEPFSDVGSWRCPFEFGIQNGQRF